MSLTEFKNEIGIVDASYYLPGERVDIVEWAKVHQVDNQLVNKLLDNGCRYFYQASDQSDADLVCHAITKLQNKLTFNIKDVKYLIHARTQAFSMPSPPHSIVADVASRMSFKPKLSFSVSHLACASVVNALSMAYELLADDETAKYALVVTSDRVFGDAEFRIRQDSGIQSDGGTAILVGREAIKATMKGFQSSNFAKLNEGPGNRENIQLIGRYTWLHTKALFVSMKERGVVDLEKVHILPINADRSYWNMIGKGLGISQERIFVENIKARGHACSCDFAINLVDIGFTWLKEGKEVAYCGQSNVGSHAVITLGNSMKQKQNTMVKGN